MSKKYATKVEVIDEEISFLFSREMIESLKLLPGEILECEVSDDKNTITLRRNLLKGNSND